MKKVILLAALLGSVSFASKADEKPTTVKATLAGVAPVSNPNRWMSFPICGVCGEPDFVIAVDDEDIENSLAVIGLYIDIQIEKAGCC